MRFEQLNPKNQKFLKMDVPIDRYSIVQLFPYFSLNNEIEESVGNLFYAFRVAESKKPKIFKNGRSYRPLFNCIAFVLFFFKQRDREKCCNLFYAFRVAESKKPKIFKNGRSYRPLFNCIAFSLFFFKQRDREECWEPFLCVSSS